MLDKPQIYPIKQENTNTIKPRNGSNIAREHDLSVNQYVKTLEETIMNLTPNRGHKHNPKEWSEEIQAIPIFFILFFKKMIA